MVVVMADAGYQFVISVIFVMVKRDFDYCEGFGSDSLGLVGDVAVEFGLGEGLVVNLLKLSGGKKPPLPHLMTAHYQMTLQKRISHLKKTQP
jgi:hypothetical protein